MKSISYRTIYRAMCSTTLLKISMLGMIFSPLLVHAETDKNALGVEHLSADLRSLLTKEMQAIELGMKNIISANAAGDSETIASIAMKIKESFILKQSLTKHQKHELHTKLPQDFVNQDQQFHYMAGMLAHAAEMKKPELINFYYFKLFEACSSCHKEHAQHRFSHFSVSQAVKHSH